MSIRAMTRRSSPRASYWSWPGTSASSTRWGAAPRTVGTTSGSSKGITAASEAQNGGVTFNHTGPTVVASRQMLERFQVRTCTGGPVTAMSRAASVSRAQSRSRWWPPGSA